MSGFCSLVSQALCRGGYKPLCEEETVVSEHDLTRREVRARVAQAVGDSHLLPPLANIVSQYAVPLTSDRIRFPRRDSPGNIDQIVDELFPLVQDMYRARMTRREGSESEFTRECIDLWFNTLSQLTCSQYRKVWDHPRMQVSQLPKGKRSGLPGTNSIVADMEEGAFRLRPDQPLWRELAQPFQELIDYCNDHTNEGADSVIDLLAQFYRNEANFPQYKAHATPFAKFVAGATLAYYRDGQAVYREKITGVVRYWSCQWLLGKLIDAGHVTIPQTLLDRCGGNLGLSERQNQMMTGRDSPSSVRWTSRD